MDHIWFDIFRGKPEATRLWLQCVTDLDSAILEMKRISAKEPGDYFVSESATGKVRASVERNLTLPFYASDNATQGHATDAPKTRSLGR